MKKLIYIKGAKYSLGFGVAIEFVKRNLQILNDMTVIRLYIIGSNKSKRHNKVR